MTISVTKQTVALYCPCGCPCTIHLTVTREVEAETQFSKGKDSFPETTQKILSTKAEFAETTCKEHFRVGALTHIASHNRLCLRCGKTWIARWGEATNERSICPRCKSRYWNEPDETKIPHGGEHFHRADRTKKKHK